MKNEDDDLIVEEDVVEDNNIEEAAIEKSEAPEEESPESIQDDDEEEDRIVTIGDSEPEAPEEEEEAEEHQDPQHLVKKLRGVTRGLEKKAKVLEREKKALEKQLAERAKSAEIEKPVELGEEPTLKGMGYDDVKFKEAIIAYSDRKKKVEEQEAKKAKEAEKVQEKWQSKQKAYISLKEEHKFKDFEDAEELVSNTFSQTQQGIIVQGAEDAALLVYALGKNPKKLEELANISDPVDFAFKVAKLESQLKVSSKKAPKPEKRVSGGKSGGISGSSDKTLERLRSDAEKSGDYSKVLAYKKQLRNKG